ncbi:MAG: T9SS type A sorting domain-containing protein [Bacteroidota bacterium]
MHTAILSSQLLFFYLFLFFSVQAQQKNSSCNFFEEENGLLVIEMESLPLLANWEVANDIPGYTGTGYIQWTGPQYFNQVGRGSIRFNIRINTPGTYIFDWRVAVGKGDDDTRHNDTWLKINGDVFYAKKGVLFLSPLKPRPACAVDPNFDCPNGSSAGGFFKVFGGNINRFEWKAQTSDRDAHDIVVRFDHVGTYQLEINARSSFQAIDRMILWNTQAQRAINAEKLSNRASDCLIGLVTSRNQMPEKPVFRVFPNPVSRQLKLDFAEGGKKEIILRNTLGEILSIYDTHENILLLETEGYPRGLYTLEVKTRGEVSRKKILIRKERW